MAHSRHPTFVHQKFFVFFTTNQHKFGSKHLLTSFNLPLACPLVCPNRPSLMWQKLPEAFILCFQGLHELFQTGKCRELPKHTDISPLRSKLVLTSFTVHARHCQRKNQKTASKIKKKIYTGEGCSLTRTVPSVLWAKSAFVPFSVHQLTDDG